RCVMQGRPGAHWCNIRATGNGGDGSGAVTMTSGISLRAPGAILLISCYELGHQPLGAAWPRAFLERAGYAPDTLDLAVEPLDEAKVRRARLAGIAVPVHTAAGSGTRAAERVRARHPRRRITRYVSLSRDGRLTPAGYVEASRGCLHECLHCPIPPVYGGRFFAVPRDVVLEDVRRLVAAGAGHITFGDPDFLNGPGHA